MDKIYTGNDRAHELHLKNYRELIAYLCRKNGEKWNGQIDPDAAPANAFIDWGRWAWACECGNQMYAEPADPIGFCDQCGNVFANGLARPILFPENRKEIENALLERELHGHPLLKDKLASKMGGSQLALMPQFKPVNLSRSWNGESVDKLHKEHIKAMKKDEAT